MGVVKVCACFLHADSFPTSFSFTIISGNERSHEKGSTKAFSSTFIYLMQVLKGDSVHYRILCNFHKRFTATPTKKVQQPFCIIVLYDNKWTHNQFSYL